MLKCYPTSYNSVVVSFTSPECSFDSFNAPIQFFESEQERKEYKDWALKRGKEKEVEGSKEERELFEKLRQKYENQKV